MIPTGKAHKHPYIRIVLHKYLPYVNIITVSSLAV